MGTRISCIFAFAAGVCLLAGCASHGEQVLQGEWLQPVPGMAPLRQGFRLEADGTAGSVGMATLQYETWRWQGDDLLLSGRSIGNGQTIRMVDTLRIVRLTADTLVVVRGTDEEVFVRNK